MCACARVIPICWRLLRLRVLLRCDSSPLLSFSLFYSHRSCPLITPLLYYCRQTSWTEYVTWYDMIWCDILWCYAIWHILIWCDAIWYIMIWFTDRLEDGAGGYCAAKSISILPSHPFCLFRHTFFGVLNIIIDSLMACSLKSENCHKCQLILLPLPLLLIMPCPLTLLTIHNIFYALFTVIIHSASSTVLSSTVASNSVPLCSTACTVMPCL